MLDLYNVSKLYRLYRRPLDRMWSVLGKREGRCSEFWAVRNVNLRLRRGEIVGIIGPNGSGKSTLLQLAAGVLQPSEGRVSARGRIAALLELGAGFNPEFTGRENVLFSSELMGKSRTETLACVEAIEAFAEIGDFIDRPVKEYSSGMYVRLAFSTAIHVSPDVLLVDEALSVGDAAFSSRCFRKLDELRDSGVSILFVSHDLGAVKRLCHRALLMNRGSVMAEGAPSDVVNRYVAWVHEGDAEAVTKYALRRRHGDGASTIVAVEVLDASERSATVVSSGEAMTVVIRATCGPGVANPVVGFLIRNKLGVDVYGTNTRIEGVTLDVTEGDTVEVRFTFPCGLARQEYSITAAIQHPDGRSQDWHDDAVPFQVAGAKDIAGVADLGARVSFRKLISEHGSSSDSGRAPLSRN